MHSGESNSNSASEGALPGARPSYDDKPLHPFNVRRRVSQVTGSRTSSYVEVLAVRRESVMNCAICAACSAVCIGMFVTSHAND